jgi:hypothetical protein
VVQAAKTIQLICTHCSTHHSPSPSNSPTHSPFFLFLLTPICPTLKLKKLTAYSNFALLLGWGCRDVAWQKRWVGGFGPACVVEALGGGQGLGGHGNWQEKKDDMLRVVHGKKCPCENTRPETNMQVLMVMTIQVININLSNDVNRTKLKV